MSALFRLHVPGQAASWTPPYIFKHKHSGKRCAVSKPSLVAWQHAIEAAAKEAMGDRPPLDFPLWLKVTFVVRRSHVADLTNLVKALEDGCNGIVWTDDRIISRHSTRRIVAAGGVAPHVVMEVHRDE